MTPPARKASPPTDGAPASGTARWLNMVTTTVLGAAVLIVAIAALPSVLRASLGPSADEQQFAPPVRAQHPTFVPRSHPGGHFQRIPNDDALQDEEDNDLPPGMRGVPSPTDPRAKPPRAPSLDDDDLGLEGGVTVRPFALRDKRTNAVVHEVRAGEKVQILTRDGEWVLVVKGDHGEMVTGWARRSELRLR